MPKVQVTPEEFADIILITLFAVVEDGELFSSNELFRDTLNRLTNAKSVLTQFYLSTDPRVRQLWKLIYPVLAGTSSSDGIIRIIQNKGLIPGSERQLTRVIKKLLKKEDLSSKELVLVKEVIELDTSDYVYENVAVKYLN